MISFLWWLVPAAPLLGLVLIRWGERALPWLCLTCLPALLLTCWPVEHVTLSLLWPGAQWGVDDNIARGFLGFTAVLWGGATIYAAVSEKNHARRSKFWVYWLLSLSGNLLLVIAQDAASFYVGFTVMSLAAYGLVVHLGGPRPRQAGRVYLQLAVLGEMLFYAGMMLRVHESGGLMSFLDWQTAPIGGLTAILLLVGLGIKAGFWPLHVWLPLAHPAAPAAASAVLSGAMIKAGILGIWRFMPAGDSLLQEWAGVLFALAMISVFYGALLGSLQTHAKAALAYSSVSQMGYLLAIVALAWLNPAERSAWGVLLVLYAIHHGFAKGALFMGAGLSARYAMSKWQWLLLALPAVALAGLPITSGAIVKLLLKDGMYATSFSNWLPLLSLGSVATGIVVARAVWLMYQANRLNTQNNDGKLTKPPRGVIYPWAFLSLTPLLLPSIWHFRQMPLTDTLTLDKTWSLLWPLLLTAAMVVIALARGWTTPGKLTDLPNPARYISLRLKHLLLRPPIPQIELSLHWPNWRRRERVWNRFWQQGTVAVSAWLICLGLLSLVLVTRVF